MEDRKWVAIISTRYCIGNSSNRKVTVIAELTFKAVDPLQVVKLGNAWIEGEKLLNTFVSSVDCLNPVQLDFSTADLS